MANYTITNLKQDVEDTAGARTDSVRERFARKYLDSRELGISYFRYAPGFRAPVGHRHREQEEVYVVVARLREGEAGRRDHRRPPVGCPARGPEVGRAFEAARTAWS